MWERHIKNQFGRIKEIFKGKRDDDFDVLSQDTNNLNYNPTGIEVKYIVESLNKRNDQAFEESQLVGSNVNPWELFDQFFTDSFGDAIHELLIRMFDPDTVNEPQLTMYIKDSNGNGAEVTANMPGTSRNSVRLMVNDEMRKRNITLEKELETLSTEIDSMREFIKQYHAEEMYRKFKEERRSN